MFNFILSSILLVSILEQTFGEKAFFDPPVLLDLNQIQKLQQLRGYVLPKIKEDSILHSTVKDDLFLVKWLEAWDWDLSKTIEKFTHHLEWRVKEDIDKLDEEDWSYFKMNYPAFIEGHDKSSRPVAEIWLDMWDLRKAVIIGQRKRLSRWITRVFELQQRSLYQARREGSNATQAVLLIDLEHFGMLTHACRSCLPVYETMGTVWENHYPHLYEAVIGINSTPHFQVVRKIISPVMRKSTADATRIYTTKKTWLPILDAKLEKDERSIKFGGTLTKGFL